MLMVHKMKQEVIQLAEGILTGARDRQESLALHELLWTIDAQQRQLASPEEINTALARVEGFSVERSDSVVHLRPCDSVEQARITENDLGTAMKNYRSAIRRIRE